MGYKIKNVRQAFIFVLIVVFNSNEVFVAKSDRVWFNQHGKRHGKCCTFKKYIDSGMFAYSGLIFLMNRILVLIFNFHFFY